MDKKVNISIPIEDAVAWLAVLKKGGEKRANMMFDDIPYTGMSAKEVSLYSKKYNLGLAERMINTIIEALSELEKRSNLKKTLRENN